MKTAVSLFASNPLSTQYHWWSLRIVHICSISRLSGFFFSIGPSLWSGSHGLNRGISCQVFLMIDFSRPGCPLSESTGWHRPTLERFEKLKMASKMAAIWNKRLELPYYYLYEISRLDQNNGFGCRTQEVSSLARRMKLYVVAIKGNKIMHT
jgi:hypothetical protein